MALEIELAFFNEQKPELLAHYRGQVALIKDRKLLGTFTTAQEAFSAGVQRLGNQSFLIKEIKEEEPVEFIPALIVGTIRADS